MKKLFSLITVFLVNFSFAEAQTSELSEPPSKNTIKVGVGPTLFGYGDIRGLMQYTEYSRQVLPYLQVSAGFSLAQASSTIHRWQQAAAKTLDFNIAFSPMRSSTQSFKIGAGVSGRHLTDIYSIGSRTYERGPEYIMVEEFEKHKFNSIGYTVLLEYEYLLGERWAIGTRASFQNYRLGSTVLFFGINGGVRF